MKGLLKKISLKHVLFTLAFAMVAVMAFAFMTKVNAAEVSVLTDETTTATADNSTSIKAISAAVAIAIVAGIGAMGMAWSITKSADAISRQPEAEGSIRTSMMLGLVFIETAIIYALIVAILIIFVL